MIALVYGREVYWSKTGYWVQEYTDCGLPKVKDYCKHFKTLQGALMWCTRHII